MGTDGSLLQVRGKKSMKTTDFFLLILLGLFTCALPSPFKTEADTSFVIPSLGEVRIAAILVTFQNDPDNTPFLDGDIPLTPKRCRSFLFDSTYSVAGFFAENSYGKFTLTGDVYGPYELPVEAPCAEDGSSCRVTQEVFAAADADVDFSQYDIILTIYPRSRDAQGNYVNFCGFQGGADVTLGQQTNEGIFKFGLIWINGYQDLHIIAHEIGHLLGLGHASTWKSSPTCDYHFHCTYDDTNDPYDVMGFNSAIGYTGPGHFSAGAKYALGWFEQKNIRTLSASAGRSRITLFPLEASSDSTQIILIPRTKSTFYALEYRRPIGYDSILQNIDGLLIKWFTTNLPSRGSNLINPVCNSDQLFLPLGERFADGNSFLEITPVKMDDSAIELEIVFFKINLTMWQENFVWPDTVELYQGLDIPFNIRNDSPFDLHDPIRVSIQTGVSPECLYNSGGTEIKTLHAGETRKVTVHWQAEESSCGVPNYLSLYVSLAGGLAEINGSNNHLPENEPAEIFLTCNAPDLGLSSGLYPVNEIHLGETVTIQYAIKNQGNVAAGPFTMQQSIDWGVLNNTISYEGLAVGGSILVSIECRFPNFPHVFQLSISIFSSTPETNLRNNCLDVDFWCRAENGVVGSGAIFPAVGNFHVADNVLMSPGTLDKYGTNLFLYNLETGLLDMIPLKSGKEYEILSKNDITLLFEISKKRDIYSDHPLSTGTLYFCDLSSGELRRFSADTTSQSAPNLAGDWLTWFEEKDENRILHAQNLKTQQSFKIAPLYETNIFPLATADGFVYWRDTNGGDDFIWCYDLNTQTGPYSIFPIVTYYFSFDVLDDAIAWTQGDNGSNNQASVNYGQIDHQLHKIVQIRKLLTLRWYSGYVHLLKSFVFWGENTFFNLSTNKAYPLPTNPYDQVEIHDGNVFYSTQRSGSWSATGNRRLSIYKESLDSLITTVDERVEQQTTIGNHHLLQNYPNPFNATTIIAYELAQPARIELAVFNLAGQRIKTLVNGTQQQGSCKIVWDGTNEADLAVADGIYFYHFRTDDGQSIFSETRKMVLLK
jgi:M6 family metalloprotease-like protein